MSDNGLYTYDTLMERVHRAKEKDMMTDYLRDMTDEEREAMEEQANAELKAGEKNVITEMNRDIYVMEQIAEEKMAQQIEVEEMRLDHLGEDNDHTEMDGDEFFKVVVLYGITGEKETRAQGEKESRAHTTAGTTKSNHE